MIKNPAIKKNMLGSKGLTIGSLPQPLIPDAIYSPIPTIMVITIKAFKAPAPLIPSSFILIPYFDFLLKFKF